LGRGEKETELTLIFAFSPPLPSLGEELEERVEKGK